MMSNNKLHLGCGSIRFAGWVNIDLDSPVADIQQDLTEPLPFADGTVTHIFNEHFIEHITRSQAVSFLLECHRVLSAEGVIRITTPNLRFLISAYLAGSKEAWGELWQPDTRCLMMNEGMRSWGHEFVYDAEELVRILIEAGFNSISFQAYRDSRNQELCGLESRPFHNELIVEARKSESLTQSVDYSVIKNNEAKWSEQFLACGQRATVLEQELIDQGSHLRQIKVESVARWQVIEDQIAHIHRIEEESSIRAHVIDDQIVHIHRVEEESSMRAHVIEDQIAHIQKVEEESSARAHVIVTYEQMLEEQVVYGRKIEAELTVFRLSWYGKLKSIFSKFHNKNLDAR